VGPIARAEVVQHANLVSAGDESIDEMRTDKSRAPCHKTRHHHFFPTQGSGGEIRSCPGSCESFNRCAEQVKGFALPISRLQESNRVDYDNRPNVSAASG